MEKGGRARAEPLPLEPRLLLPSGGEVEHRSKVDLQERSR